MKTNTLILIFLCCLGISRAQDPHFSQFFASPLTLNPANTGNFNGLLRLAGNHRNQWPGFGNAYITTTAAVDGHLLEKRIPDADRLSAGLLMLSDQTGNGILKENHLLLSLAYQKSFDNTGNHSLTIGFQGGLGSYRFDQNKANFEDEISPSGFTIPSTEILLTNDLGKQYLDLHTGILYKGNFNDGTGIYFGGSIYHLGRPTIGFASTDYRIQKRINIQGGGFKEIGYFTTLHTSFQYQQHFNYKEFVWGAAVSHVLIDNKKIYTEVYAGSWLRNGDAFIPYLGLEWNNLRAGFSYDINYSRKKAVSNLYQSAEFSITWLLNQSTSLPGVKCPKF